MSLVALARARAAHVMLIVGVLVLGVLAVRHRGVPIADVQLNDGGVWVTNVGERLVAHLNYPSHTLDGGLRSPSAAFDVSQHGNDIQLHDASGSALQTISPSSLALGNTIAVPNGYSVDQGGGTSAVLDSHGGRVWVVTDAEVGGFTPDLPPILKDAQNARLVVGIDGRAHIVAPDGSVRTITRSGTRWNVAGGGRISGYNSTDDDQLSTVGDAIVVLDRTTRTLQSTRASTPLTDVSDPVLQLPGPAADAAIVAGTSSLITVPLGGRHPDSEQVAGGAAGTPARPAVLNGCIYAAWGGTGAYRRNCAEDADDQTRSVDKLTSASALQFRVNRDLIVLNDTGNGNVFLVNQNMQLVDNWDDISAQLEQKDLTATPRQGERDVVKPPDHSGKNHRPDAVNDEFGVRPGQSTTLPVLVNDTDQDGDVLIATPVASPPLGQIARVRGGEALQITVGRDKRGSDSFSYQVDDGRGLSDQASVRITVHDWLRNAAPVQRRSDVLTVESGKQIAFNALSNWIDPDGDAVFLKSAAAPKGIDVHTRPDGLLTIRDLGTAPIGRKEITLVVSDGRADGTATLELDVKPSNTAIVPIANPDHAQVLRGRSIIVAPLANDSDPTGAELRLTKVAAPKDGSTRITPDFRTGKFTFTSMQTGTQYVDYAISNGPHSADSWVRVDVIDPPKSKAPVADNDVALLPVHDSVTVHPLLNDSDPNGGVLVVLSVSVAEDSGLVVAVVQHESLRITAPSGLTAPASFKYTISNGAATAEGQVTVVPLPPVSTAVPPVALDDAATVRAGDIVTVPVLDNDTSAADLPLKVDPKLRTVGPSLGTAFVSENTVRLKAGSQAGRMRLVYTVHDDHGNFASADVVLTVRALDGKNAPPVPQPLTARVLAGSSVSVEVPLDGIDPDGDLVALIGVDAAPTRGTARVEKGQLVYQAPASASGTDHFTYRVADRFGAEATASVDVGIAPPAPVNQAPVALPDTVSARTGRQLAVAVTSNDIDPDGDPLTVVGNSIVPTDSQTTVAAKVVGGRVSLTTPAAPGTLRYYYRITDGRGGISTGVLSVTVSQNAPLQPPIARDDVVDPSAVFGRSEVVVDALANDEDPDGAIGALRVTSTESGVVVHDNELTIPVTADRRVVVYTTTDPDGLTASAVVIVPGRSDGPPTLKPGVGPIKAKAGELVLIPLANYVVVRPGHQAQLTYEKDVHSGPGTDGRSLVRDKYTLAFTSTPSFSGMTFISFQVTDGGSPDDPEGLRSTLSLQVEVTAAQGSPPVFRPSEVTAAAGEAATKADLREMVTDPDTGDKLQFSLGSKPSGVSVSLSGSVLSVSAPPTTPPGSAAHVTVTVTDGRTPPVTGQVPIRVLASTRPVMTVQDLDITDANSGQPRAVDVTKQVIDNPFAAEGKPVTLVGRPRLDTGGGTVTADGTLLTITPAVGFHGQLSVSYTLADATNDKSRYADGVIRMTVRDRPDRPRAVTAETHLSQTATVTWIQGAANGADVKGFVVFWTAKQGGSAGSQPCPGQVTSCTIDNLTNNATYTFTVVEQNEVGDSDRSEPSNAVRPDVKPDQPQPPSVTFGDKQVHLSWVAPHTDGSPVTSYSLRISGSGSIGGATERSNITGLSYDWTGLDNGSSYQFSVEAHSGAEEPSDWSELSDSVVPAGVPEQVGKPTVTKDPASTLPASITVKWTAPNANGDDNLTYQVREVSTRTIIYQGTGTQVTQQFSSSTQDKQFAVLATNKAGPAAAWSEPSDPVRAFQKPGSVGNLAATPTGSNNQVRITFTAADGNGADPSEMSYTWTAGTQSGTLPVGGGDVTNAAAFPNGTSVSVAVYASSNVHGEVSDGPASTVSGVNAYGPPNEPSVSAQGNVNNVTLRWNAAGSGNGRSVQAVQIETTDGGVQGVGISGSTDQGNGRNQTKQIRARAQDTTGVWSQWSGWAAASTWGDHHYDVSHEGAGSCSYINNTCRLVDLTLTAWNPNSQVRCFAQGVGASSWTNTVTVDGNGNHTPFHNGSPGPLFDTSGDRFSDGRDTGDFTCTQL